MCTKTYQIVRRKGEGEEWQEDRKERKEGGKEEGKRVGSGAHAWMPNGYFQTFL